MPSSSPISSLISDFQLPRATDVLLVRPLVLRSGLHGPVLQLSPAHAQTLVLGGGC